MSMNESVTEFPEVLPSYFPPPYLLICKSWGVVVVLILATKLLLHSILSSLFL